MEIHNRLKNEVMKDYFTANVKAEVLIDTILTPVIDEILTFFVNGKDSDSKVKLLAKNFRCLCRICLPARMRIPVNQRSCHIGHAMWTT